jgi:hypothetical protein
MDLMVAGVSTRANFLSYFNGNMNVIDAAIAKCNFSAATDPTVNDDSNDGYAVGSFWVNTTGHKIFQAESVAVGAAVWRQLYPVDVAAAIHAASGKATPVDADEFDMADSAASWILKKITWAEKKAALKAYFDTIYPLRSLLTTRGDLYYRGASDIARLAGAEQGSILYEDSNLDPTWLLHGNYADQLMSGGHGVNPFFGGGDGWIPAGETWTYASADDPSFTFTISGDKTSKYYPGMKIKLTQTTAKYFIITKVAYGAPNTTVTIYGGTDYDLANAAITSPYYSMVKIPAGFPISPAKWTITVTDSSDRSQASPVAGTWYNLGSLQISIPVGAWHISCSVFETDDLTAVPASYHYLDACLATVNNGCDIPQFHWFNFNMFKGCNFKPMMYGIYEVAAKTTLYLNACFNSDKTCNTINFHNDWETLVIKAVCAYL